MKKQQKSLSNIGLHFKEACFLAVMADNTRSFIMEFICHHPRFLVRIFSYKSIKALGQDNVILMTNWSKSWRLNIFYRIDNILWVAVVYCWIIRGRVLHGLVQKVYKYMHTYSHFCDDYDIECEKYSFLNLIFLVS